MNTPDHGKLSEEFDFTESLSSKVTDFKRQATEINTNSQDSKTQKRDRP